VTGLAIGALGAVAVALMVWFQVGKTRRVGRDRRAAVVRAAALLDEAEVVQDGIGYPSLRGRYRGVPVKVDLIVDTLTLRQLPRLWLAAAVHLPTDVDPPVDLVLRPLATDIVSPGARFRWEHAPLPDWPVHLRVASAGPVELAPLGAVEVLTDVLHEARTKSVLLAPGGVRIVTELARGEVASHRVVRRPDFRFVLDPARLAQVLDDALAIATQAHLSAVEAVA
jgi:hypothetical protein